MIKYLKRKNRQNRASGKMLVVEDVEISVNGIIGAYGTVKPENPILTIKKGEILVCNGGCNSAYYIGLLKTGKKINILFDEFDKIKTLQVGDYVRISTPTGGQAGKVEEISAERDWITISNLKGTQEFPNQPAGDSMFIGADNILAIAGSFEEIYSDPEAQRKIRKLQDREEFRKSLEGGNLSRREIEELTRFSFDKAAKTLFEQVKEYYLKIKRYDLKSADTMLSEIGSIEENDDDAKRCNQIVGKYIRGIVMYFKGERIY